MTSRHPRFVTTCQQLLVLGVIGAALTPAASVMSLDLVPHGPEDRAVGDAGAPGTSAPASMAAYVRANQTPSVVPTEVVDPTVREIALTAPAGARIAPGSLKASMRRSPGGGSEVLSAPQSVTGYGAVGVTWQHGVTLGESDVSVQVRTYGGENSGGDGNSWSQWMDVDYREDHGPDTDSDEARRARPGTDAMLVGDVDRVQVRVDTDRAAPPDLKLAVVDPGEAATSAREMPAIDTGKRSSATSSAPSSFVPDETGDLETGDPETGDPETGDPVEGDATLAASRVTPKPVIYSRAQWGADEGMREKSSLHYYEVHAGFVHHTVNANDYSRAEVPGILRSIYAYHTRSRGWSDIGYNFLVDRFGRIWEGRYGGVDRPVVGAHTLGYNDDSFAMSAIGNYEITEPSKRMVQAYGALFGWKLSLHGVNAGSNKQYVTSRNFKAINGHRDADSTACPGKYLYAKIPEIRRLAVQAQVGFSGRELESNLVGMPQPDLMVRRASDKRLVLLPIVRGKKSLHLGRPVVTSTKLGRVDRIFSVGDWDRDGHSDLVARRIKDGALTLRLGDGTGKFGTGKPLATGFGNVDLLAAVGDMTGDGYPDLMGQPRGAAMRIYPGNGTKGLRASYVAHSSIAGGRQMGIGRWDRDGAPDTLIRDHRKLSVIHGNGPGGLTGSPRKIDVSLEGFDWTVGISDVGLSGHADLVVRRRSDSAVYLVPTTSKGIGTPVALGKATGYDLVD